MTGESHTQTLTPGAAEEQARSPFRSHPHRGTSGSDEDGKHGQFDSRGVWLGTVTFARIHLDRPH